MLIDWFTVVAQIVNFLVLVWLLKRFLYKPVLRAVDERERSIRAQVEEAAERNEAAEQERLLYSRKNEAFEAERAAMEKKAEAEVKAERQRLLESAHQDYKQLWLQKLNALEAEERELHRDIIQKTKDEVFAIARKVLADMASVSLEEQMTASFIRQMDALSETEREPLVQSFQSSRMPIILRSAFTLQEPQQQAVQLLMDRMLGSGTPIRFETSPELITGIELISNGYKVAWSVADALAASGKHAERTLRELRQSMPQEGEDIHGISQPESGTGSSV